jgi:hypothetical protein
MNVDGEFFICDAVDFDADPTATTDVRRPVKFLRRLFDQHLLNADRGRHGHRDMAVVVVIVRKHGKDFLADKPRWFAVRDLFPRFRKRETNPAYTLDLLFAVLLFAFPSQNVGYQRPMVTAKAFCICR